MSVTWMTKNLSTLCVAGAALLASGSIAPAGSTGDCLHCCPPPYKHCSEGPPKIKFKCGCPKPVCDPCSLPSWGYFENCWRPWPFATNWSYCARPHAPHHHVMPPGNELLPPPRADAPTKDGE